MEELRVPKRRVPVEIVQPIGPARRVAVFLAEGAAHHAGPERLSDLLNGEVEFLPAFDEEAGVMTFLNRRSVVLARVAHEVEADVGDQVTIPIEHEVEITLSRGDLLRGVVSYVRPPPGRLLDFLNEPAPFFRLLERDAAVLVSRHHVARVALTDA
jgi:hypothetical protein